MFGRPVSLTLVALVAVGCAHPLPSFAGARTTPNGRADLLLGGGYRIATGALDQAAPLGLALASGAAPEGAVRVGVGDDCDVGVLTSGLALHLEGRCQHALSTRYRVHIGLSAYGGGAGSLTGELVSAPRLGGVLPVTLTMEVTALFEAWLGARAALEWVGGASEAWSVRGGGVVGLATGFRRVFVLAEVAVDAEHWSLATGTLFGVSVTPALGLRMRF